MELIQNSTTCSTYLFTQSLSQKYLISSSWRPRLHPPGFVTSAGCQVSIREPPACTHPGSSRNRHDKENKPTFSRIHWIFVSFINLGKWWSEEVQHTTLIQNRDGEDEVVFFLSPGFPWDLAPTKSLSLLSIEIAEIPSGRTPLCYITCLILAFDAIRCLCCCFFFFFF